MAVYKYAPGKTWYVKCRYKTHMDEVKYCTKRGFATKKEAVNWEHNFLAKHNGQLDMTFASFVELYEENQASRLRESTTYGKESILAAKILPVFGDQKLMDITPAMVILIWKRKHQRKLVKFVLCVVIRW